MSMPPQGPNGPQNPDPYGASSPGEWNPNQGWDPTQPPNQPWGQGSRPNTGSWEANQPHGVGGRDASQQTPDGWGANQQPDPYQQADPYQQQHDAYTQPHPPYGPEQPYGTQQMPQAYDPSLSAASMSAAPAGPAAGGPTGPGWNQQPKTNKLPWIVATAIVVVGAVVAVIILVTGKDDDKSAGPTDPAGQSQVSGGSEPSDDGGAEPSDDGGSEPSDDGGSEPSDDGGSEPSDDSGSTGYSSSLPANFPVPGSVTVDDSGTFCSGDSCIGTFEADDPEQAYYDWIDALENAGYTITSQEITGSGSGAIWAIDAEGDLSISLYWASTGALLSS